MDAPDGVPARMALCDHHVAAVSRARADDPALAAERRREAERAAWQRTFHEPAPFN